MNEITEAVKPKRNAILIHANDGKVAHTFLPESEAHVQFDELQRTCAGGSVLILEADCDAEFFLQFSPGLRERVAEAKFELARAIKWNEVMDRHGVPADPETRAKALKAAQEIVDTTIGDALRRH